MTIAINSTPLIKSFYNDFFYEYFVSVAISKPEHLFIFITPAVINEQLIASPNIIPVISSPRANNLLMWRIWFDYTLPGIVRKHKADIIIHTGGVCSLRTKVPQYLIISDLSFLYYPPFFSKKQQYFFKKNMPAWLLKANTIVSASGFLTKEIIRQYSVNDEKISTLQLIASDLYRPADWEEKESIKEQYAGGKEYFLFSGEIHPRNNLVNLLKAFSFFKKRQKSNMQLIITSKAVSANDPFMENLKTYKYRKEVIVLMDLPAKELAKITTACYAFLYPSYHEGMPIFVLQAMQCEVPVITANTGALTDATGDAALFVDPDNFEDIADKMMLVFKDEKKRSDLIKGGNIIIQKNNTQKMDDFWWNSMLALSTKVVREPLQTSFTRI